MRFQACLAVAATLVVWSVAWAGYARAGDLSNPATLNEQAPAVYKAKFDTSKGPFVVEVNRDWAPNGETARIAFSALGAPPNTAILFLVAGYPADVPLWPLGNPCSLLVDNPPFSQLHQTDSNGDYTFSKAIGGIPPFMVHVQFLSVEFVDNQFVIGVSNGIHMSCQ